MDQQNKTRIVHFRVPAELFDWSMAFASGRGWTGAQYMRLLMEAKREETYTPDRERPASDLLDIAMQPFAGLIKKPTESPAVEPNGH